MDKVFSSAKELKIGKYILIDDTPCRIASMDKSKPGKHGAAKLRIVAIGVFDGSKKNWLGSTDSDVEVPMIEKRTAQVLSISGNIANIMDAETYENFELEIPQEFQGQVVEGGQILYWVVLGQKVMKQVKSGAE